MQSGLSTRIFPERELKYDGKQRAPHLWTVRIVMFLLATSLFLLTTMFGGLRVPGWIAALRAAQENREPESVFRVAHGVSGSVGYFRGAGVRKRASDLEAMGRAGRLDDAAAQLPDDHARRLKTLISQNKLTGLRHLVRAAPPGLASRSTRPGGRPTARTVRLRAPCHRSLRRRRRRSPRRGHHGTSDGRRDRRSTPAWRRRAPASP